MSNVISAVFAYAKVTEAAPKYQSTEKEYSIDLIVDKATAKAFGKQFPKQKGKTVDNEDFETIYKIPVPFPDQDEQYVLKLKKKEKTAKGEFLPKPGIFVKVDGKAVPLKEGVLIANGSKGKVSYSVRENDYGIFAGLKDILVEELIEYKQAGKAGEDFGLEIDYSGGDFADTDNDSKVEVPVKAVEKASKTSKKTVPPLDEDDSSDSPF